MTALGRPPADISWVGSIQVFLLFFIGTFTGRLTDAGYFRAVFLTGSILGAFGLFMASLSTQYWQLFLAQGVCCGIGNGCLFCPALSVLSTYFSKRRSLAIGLAAAGSSTGGMVVPAMVQQLLPKAGFAWTMRSLGFIQLGCLIFCNIGIKPRVPPRRTGSLVDWASFKDAPYVLFAAGMFFVRIFFSSRRKILMIGTEFLGRLLRLLLHRFLCPHNHPPPVHRIRQPPHSIKRCWSRRPNHSQPSRRPIFRSLEHPHPRRHRVCHLMHLLDWSSFTRRTLCLGCDLWYRWCGHSKPVSCNPE